MVDINFYQTLDVHPMASQAEIKQAYRRLAKLFHPDSHHAMADHGRIAQVNAAYEVLKDPQRRQAYDQQRRAQTLVEHGFGVGGGGSQQTQGCTNTTPQAAQTMRETDVHLQQWLMQVYSPINRQLAQILDQLSQEVQDLSADPFDDELMADFQDYLNSCRGDLDCAQATFQSMPNPASMAGVAALLYYCMNHIEDGIEDMERFTLCYDDQYLNTGRELFRMSARLRTEAREAMSARV